MDLVRTTSYQVLDGKYIVRDTMYVDTVLFLQDVDVYHPCTPLPPVRVRYAIPCIQHSECLTGRGIHESTV